MAKKNSDDIDKEIQKRQVLFDLQRAIAREESKARHEKRTAEEELSKLQQENYIKQQERQERLDKLQEHIEEKTKKGQTILVDYYQKRMTQVNEEINAEKKLEDVEEKRLTKKLGHLKKVHAEAEKERKKADASAKYTKSLDNKKLKQTLENLPGGGDIQLPGWADKIMSPRGKRAFAFRKKRAAYAMRESIAKEGSPIKAIGTGVKTMFKGMGGIGSLFKMLPRLLGPIGIILTIVQAIQKLFGMAKEYDNMMAGAAKSLGIQKDQAKEMAKQVRSVEGLTTTFKKTLPYITAMKDEFGKAGMGGEFIKMAAQAEDFGFHLGLSEDVSKKILTTAVGMGNTYEGFVTDVKLVTTQFNKQYGMGVDLASVLTDISQVSSNTSAIFSGNTKKLTEQVLIARRLGTTLDQAKQVSDGMLDIEGSIAKEMNARVLLGKNIQFDQARVLALQGDFAKANEKILDQVGGIHEWEKMTYLQKKAVADATGMELGQLDKSLRYRKINAEYEKSNKEEVDKLVKEMANANEKTKEKIKLQLQSLGISDASTLQEMKREEDKLSYEEKKNRIMEKFTEVIAANIPGISGLMNALGDIGLRISETGSFWGALTADKGDVAEGKAKQLINQRMDVTKQLEGEQDATKRKELNEQIKKLNESINVQIKAHNDDDVNNVSLGELEDIVNKQRQQRNEAEVSDFTINAHPKDTVLMAGGTKLGEGAETELKKNNELLEKLISAVNTPVNLQFSDGTVQKVSNRAGFLGRMSGNLGLG